MKKTKKIVSLLLTVIMVLSLGVTAFADGNTYSLTISKATAGHIYEAYQIFAGDLSADGKTLSNIVWGSGVTSDGQTALQNKYVTGEGVEKNAANVAAALTESNAAAFAEDAAKNLTTTKVTSGEFDTTSQIYTISNLAPGYYLVKDVTTSMPAGEAYTKYILKVVGNATVEVKADKTTSDKKVADKNDSDTSEGTTTWQDSADYDIGDAVPFKLRTIIASDYANYTNGYKLTFHDVENTGLTFNPSSVVVTVKTGDSVTTLTAGQYTLLTKDDKDSYANPTDSCTFEVKFDNLKNLEDSDGNKIVAAGSVITVTYNSTLNSSAVVGSAGNPNTSHVTYTNNPNDEQAGENGKTPDDKVIVFTYKTVVNKVQKNPDYAPEVEGSEEYISLEGAGFTLYKLDADATTEDKWVLVGSEVKGDKMTQFTWSGLDDGKYKLVETTTPNGYNTIAPIEFTITAIHDVTSDNPALTSLTVDNNSFTVEMTEGSTMPTGNISTDVVNQKGTELPSTGGIGTTIFYVLGTILLLGAAILLIVKRRMSAE